MGRGNTAKITIVSATYRSPTSWNHHRKSPDRVRPGVLLAQLLHHHPAHRSGPKGNTEGNHAERNRN